MAASSEERILKVCPRLDDSVAARRNKVEITYTAKLSNMERQQLYNGQCPPIDKKPQPEAVFVLCLIIQDSVLSSMSKHGYNLGERAQMPQQDG